MDLSTEHWGGIYITLCQVNKVLLCWKRKFLSGKLMLFKKENKNSNKLNKNIQQMTIPGFNLNIRSLLN